MITVQHHSFNTVFFAGLIDTPYTQLWHRWRDCNKYRRKVIFDEENDGHSTNVSGSAKTSNYINNLNVVEPL